MTAAAGGSKNTSALVIRPCLASSDEGAEAQAWIADATGSLSAPLGEAPATAAAPSP